MIIPTSRVTVIHLLEDYVHMLTFFENILSMMYLFLSMKKIIYFNYLFYIVHYGLIGRMAEKYVRGVPQSSFSGGSDSGLGCLRGK
jgi:hypothetical protein